MPELPEVETIVRELRRTIINGKIESCTVFRQDYLKKCTPADFKNFISGRFIRDLQHRGKFILCQLDKGTLLLHLGMTGKFILQAKDSEFPKHVIVLFRFRKFDLLFSDTRRFGRLEYYPLGSQISEIEHLGVEPFSPNLTIKYLKHKFSPRKRAIKELLMDQGLIAGLGNIYASEILFHARIHPLTPGKELSFSNLKDLIRGTRDVLKQAIANAGTSISDYKRLDGQSGEFQNFLSVYSKNGQPCPRCKTEIQRMMINHRSTYFCPKCQKR